LIQSLIDWVAGLPPAGIYLAIAALAALENIFPPVPADTAAALGGFLAAQNPRLSVVIVYLVTVIGNVGSATGIYLLAFRVGPDLLQTSIGKRMLSPDLVAAVKTRYEKHHTLGIFFSRCLPVYRAIVPLFAGMMRIPARKAIPAIAGASALFYGAVVWLAYRLGSNWTAVKDAVGQIGQGLAAVAGLVTIVVVVLVVRWRKRKKTVRDGPGRSGTASDEQPRA
jgi:membrane protein DedA with SNARE-associated domain